MTGFSFKQKQELCTPLCTHATNCVFQSSVSRRMSKGGGGGREGVRLTSIGFSDLNIEALKQSFDIYWMT